MASGESVYARLRTAFREGRITGARRMDHALTSYAAECAIRRLEMAGLLGDVVLKGGRLWTVWGEATSRPTQDFDYSSQIPSLRGARPDEARGYAEKVLAALAMDADDGLTMDPADFKLAFIDTDLGGCSIQGTARLHTAQVPVLIEVGFGHTLPEGAVERRPMDSILKGGGGTSVLAYTPEMWLAEKLRIAVAFGADNTRLKDYFDMHLLFAKPLDPDLLTRCFAATCADFGVAPPASADAAPGLSPAYADRNAALWRDRRWPDWTGRKFVRGADPELAQVIAGIVERVGKFGLFAQPKVAPTCG